eukprot:6843529-Pyramimonas_sp.AAC.1
MCPAAERELRVVQNDISMFERVERSNLHVTSVHKAVKKFTRTIDDPQPEEVRPYSPPLAPLRAQGTCLVASYIYY